MKSQTNCVLLIALLVAGLLGGMATPAAAADVTVGVVVASQFDSGLFIALVTATGGAALIDAQLVVNNTPVVPDAIEDYSLGGPRHGTLFKIVSYTKVVSPGDTLTAIVTDTNGAHGVRTVVCGRGVPAFRITSVCR